MDDAVKSASHGLYELLPVFGLYRFESMVEDAFAPEFPHQRERHIVRDENDGQVSVAHLQDRDQISCGNVIEGASEKDDLCLPFDYVPEYSIH